MSPPPLALGAGWSLAADRPWLFLLALPAVVPLVLAIPRLRSTRARLSSALRALGLAALVAALAGVVGLTRLEGLAVALAVDGSWSTAGEGLEAGEALRGAARAALSGGDRLAVVAFGAEPMVDAEPAARDRTHRIETRVAREGSDPAGAVALAQAILPEAAARRVVLVSDGRATRGDLTRAAAEAADRAVELDVWPVGAAVLEDALLESLELPSRVAAGEVFTVAVTARSTVPQTATVRLFVEGEPLGTRTVELAADEPAHAGFRIRATAGGSFAIKAYLEAEHDAYPANDVLSTLVRVAGAPRVLRVTANPSTPSPLERTLRGAGVAVQAIGGERVPERLAALAPYSAVILEDVPATDLSDDALVALRDFVHELGGGLVMLGGERSFAPGGYKDTAVEEALPVRCDVRSFRHRARVAIVIAIDRSGSMAGEDGGTSKIALAKTAAREVVRSLEPDDRVGVIAFDSAATWAAPLASAGATSASLAKIASIEAGGGTDFHPALSEAFAALGGDDAPSRHVLLVTDGMSAPGDFERLAARNAAKGIHLSTVAIGGDADVETLRNLARVGEGRYYLAHDVHRLPRIFVREAVLAARAHLVEEPFTPAANATGPLTEPLAANPPLLGGYVATTLKERAELHVATPTGEPLLAAWRYGLGRAVAFTSDAGGRWSVPWPETSEFAPFWEGLVRWVLRPDDSPLLAAHVEPQGDDLDVSVDAFTEDGGFANLAPLTARWFPPEGAQRSVVLRQTAPGRYEGRVVGAAGPGGLVQVERWDDGAATREPTASGDEPVPIATTTVPTPALAPLELRGFGPDLATLAEAARLTGGRVLTQAADAFRRPETVARARLPLTRPLLVFALVFLVLDVAARRVWFEWPAPLTRAVRRRAAQPTASRHAHAASAPDAGSPTDLPAAQRAGSETSNQPASASITPAPPIDEYTERLLAAKRKARRRHE